MTRPMDSELTANKPSKDALVITKDNVSRFVGKSITADSDVVVSPYVSFFGSLKVKKIQIGGALHIREGNDVEVMGDLIASGIAVRPLRSEERHPMLVCYGNVLSDGDLLINGIVMSYKSLNIMVKGRITLEGGQIESGMRMNIFAEQLMAYPQKQAAITTKGGVYVLEHAFIKNCETNISGWLLPNINNLDWGVVLNSNYMDKSQRKAFESYVRRFHESNPNWLQLKREKASTNELKEIKRYAKNHAGAIR